MITLSILIILWGIISTYKIHRICKNNDESFNPYEGGIFYYLGFIIGLAVLVVWTIYLSITFLP
jgi:hypothetical protein